VFSTGILLPSREDSVGLDVRRARDFREHADVVADQLVELCSARIRDRVM
jgi:hypothetical protein